MAPSAFVTGGTGFIGTNLLELLTDRDWNVTALCRPTSDLTYPRRFPVAFQTGSVTDYPSLLKAIPANTDVIFHLAGDTNLWSRHNRRQKEINVDGTRNMVRAARERGVKTFIYTSSASTWGNMSGKRISESVPQQGGNSWVNYEKTKWEAEQELLKNAGNEMKAVILNPSTVTGPYDLNNWGRLFFALRDGQLPGIPNGIVSVTHVHEVVKAHLSAVTNGRDGEHYLLAGEDCRFSQFIGEIARVSGVEKLPRMIPTPLLRIVAGYSAAKAVFSRREPDLTPELVKLMTRTDLSYSSRKAETELGYQILPMKRSVEDCHRWLRSEGHL